MGSGEAVLVTARSDTAGPTLVMAEAASGVGSGTGSVAAVDVIVAVLVSTAPGWSRPTDATIVKTALAPADSDPAHAMSPPAGVQLNPPGAAAETNVVPEGRVSETVESGASEGPAFVAVIV